VAAQQPRTHLICSQVRRTAVKAHVFAGQRLVNPYLGVKGSQVQILSSRRSETAR
jgi:hypothetical protein